MKPKDDLSSELIWKLFELEEPSGVLRWRKGSGSGRPYGKVVGTRRLGYLTVIINAKQYSVHRIVWFMRHGRWPNGDIDHFGNKDDNSIGMIREATRAQNLQRKRTKGKTGFRGVSQGWNGKFLAWSVENGKSKYLGSFSSAEEAAVAYDKTAFAKYGEFAKLNFPKERMAS